MRDRLKELCITETELADEIGVNQKTISHYLECEEIKLEKKQKIEIALEKFSVFNGYYHMNRAEFGDLLSSLLNEFKITQNKLAKAIGKHQKDISGYINKEKPIGTQLQYEILEFFYKKCYIKCAFGYVICDDKFDTMMELMRLIRKEEYQTMPDIDDIEEESDNNDCDCLQEDCQQYILKLPIALQNFILRNFDAYFEDTLWKSTYYYNIIDTYNMRCEWMKRFRQMSTDDQHKFVRELEQNVIIRCPQGSYEEAVFDCITDMRKIIRSNIPFTDFDELIKIEIPRSKKAQNKFKEELDIMCYNVGTQSSSVEELKMKLSFTRYEWYVWMLLLINFYNGTFPERFNKWF